MKVHCLEHSSVRFTLGADSTPGADSNLGSDSTPRADSTLESAPDPAHLTPDSTKNGNIKPLLVGFGVAVAPVLSVLLLGHVVHEVDVGHYADDDLPRLHILL